MIYLSIAGLVVTSLSLAAGYIYFRVQRASQRRNKLVATPSVQQLVQADSALASSLSVSYDGSEVRDPHVVVLNFENLGPKDIASSSFDQAKPIRVSLGRPIIAGGEESSPDGLKVAVDERGLMIGPALLAVGARHTVSVVVDGKPELEIVAPILDCDVVQTDSEEPRTLRRGAVAVLPSVFLFVSVVALVLSSLGLFSGNAERDRSDEELRRQVLDTIQQYEQTIENQQTAIDTQNAFVESLLRELASAAASEPPPVPAG